MTAYDVDRLREREFPWTARCDTVYLNSAATGPMPGRSIAATDDFTALRAEPQRVSEDLQFGTLTRSRELCARLIGADPAEIALMTNTSYGINLAARALYLAAGDIVLTHDREFPANVYPWMALERSRGVRLERIPCTGDLPDEEALLRALDRPRVRAVTLSWVSFATGYRADLVRVGAACRERGILFVVDAIQGLGAEAIDVRACGIDILACGGQKWLLSPWGTGFAYIRDDLVRALEPQAVGWMAVRGSDDFSRLTDYDLAYRPDARRFEVGTLPFQEFAGLNASIGLLFELGPDSVTAHISSLVERLVQWALSRSDVRLVTPADSSRRCGIVSMAPADAAAASARLTKAGVIHALREGAIRLSPHCFNTMADVETAIAALEW
ncbi:MAG: aminotransferase class V-fold PLP-dependent enzyme [Gemmatimonadaceae bacterium]